MIDAKATGGADSVKKQRLGVPSDGSGDESGGEDDSLLATRYEIVYEMYGRPRCAWDPPRGTDATPHTASPASDEWPSQPA